MQEMAGIPGSSLGIGAASVFPLAERGLFVCSDASSDRSAGGTGREDQRHLRPRPGARRGGEASQMPTTANRSSPRHGCSGIGSTCWLTAPAWVVEEVPLTEVRRQFAVNPFSTLTWIWLVGSITPFPGVILTEKLLLTRAFCRGKKVPTTGRGELWMVSRALSYDVPLLLDTCGPSCLRRGKAGGSICGLFADWQRSSRRFRPDGSPIFDKAPRARLSC